MSGTVGINFNSCSVSIHFQLQSVKVKQKFDVMCEYVPISHNCVQIISWLNSKMAHPIRQDIILDIWNIFRNIRFDCNDKIGCAIIRKHGSFSVRVTIYSWNPRIIDYRAKSRISCQMIHWYPFHRKVFVCVYLCVRLHILQLLLKYQ